jgi:hypothetical protein
MPSTDFHQQSKPRDKRKRKQKLLNSQSLGEIYLPEYCPMTLQAVKQNAGHLGQFKKSALGLFDNDMDELGIEKDERGLTDADFKLKMKEIRELRRSRAADMPYFNELRGVFSELADKFVQQRIASQSSLKSSLGNRVTFNKNVVSRSDEFDNNQRANQNRQQAGHSASAQNPGQNQRHRSHQHRNQK